MTTKNDRYLESRIDAVEQKAMSEIKYVDEKASAAIIALEKATTLAKENMELRQDGWNEWRGTVEGLVTDLRMNEKMMSGKASQTGLLIGYLLSFASFLLSVIKLIEK